MYECEPVSLLFNFRRKKKTPPCPEGVHMTIAPLAADWSVGPGGCGLLHCVSPVRPCSPPAHYTTEEENHVAYVDVSLVIYIYIYIRYLYELT